MTTKDAFERQRRATNIAYQLLKLGVSSRGVQELMTGYAYDLIERQLGYLPYRRAKRPEAMIVDAIRNDYSPPKDYYRAKAQTQLPEVGVSVDEGSKLCDPNAPADPD